MKGLMLCLLTAVLGCSGRTFTNLGNGVGVPSESIDNYAKEHGVTPAQARAHFRSESDAQRIKDQATKFGISEEEAKRQLEHAASR